jgi:hypothetical protein
MPADAWPATDEPWPALPLVSVYASAPAAAFGDNRERESSPVAVADPPVHAPAEPVVAEPSEPVPDLLTALSASGTLDESPVEPDPVGAPSGLNRGLGFAADEAPVAPLGNPSLAVPLAACALVAVAIYARRRSRRRRY